MLTRNFTTSRGAQRIVFSRSQGVCEKCRQRPAVHFHHLTYERAGAEFPSDLLHLCLECHITAHPQKEKEMRLWQDRMIARIKECNGEELECEWDEGEQEEPAWNLGNYKASGYDIEAVELEELQRNGP